MKRAISILTAMTILCSLFAFTGYAVTDGIKITGDGFYILSGEDSSEVSVVSKGDFIAKADIDNTSSETKMFTMILALYKDGALENASIKTVSLKAGENMELSTKDSPIHISGSAAELSSYALKMSLWYDFESAELATITKTITGPDAPAPTVAPTPQPVEMAKMEYGKQFRLKSRWNNMYLIDNGKEVAYQKYNSKNRDRFVWIFEGSDEEFRIKNKYTGNYITTSADGLKVNCRDTESLSPTSSWTAEVVQGSEVVRIKNISTDKYLNVENNAGYAQCNLLQSMKNKTVGWSMQWCVEEISKSFEDVSKHFTDIDPTRYQRERIVMLSPGHGSDIYGTTPIRFIAPGLERAVVKVWGYGDDPETDYFGRDTIVASLTLTEEGFGYFEFPADEYPFGPTQIRIIGLPEGSADEFYFQVFNMTGTSWFEGLEKAPVNPVVEEYGLQLMFEDDFDDPADFTCSNAPSKAKYSSHKPGYGDFSSVAFSDYETQKNPFLLRDGYLRIRANSNINSSGLLSTVHQDLRGTAAKQPIFMECKFVAQNFKGSWPAFWTMTTPTFGSPYDGNDELDVIEAYGFDSTQPQRNPNGYHATRHNWGHEPRLDGGKQADMANLGTGGQWYTNFHTYGLFVGPEDTIYYMDNIEVFRHETMYNSLKDYHYMMVNLAVGGASGWPWDLSRHDGISDMYVDFWRMYALEENMLYHAYN